MHWKPRNCFGGGMDERRALLAAILTEAEEDTPRLVFADWLDEHDEPERAAFIRLQCELVRLPANDPARAAVEQKAAQLHRENAQRWLEPLGPLTQFVRNENIDNLWFHRGLVGVLVFTEADFVTPDAQAVAADAF